MKKKMRVMGIVIAVIVLLIGTALFILYKSIGSMWFSGQGVDDYDTRVEIWREVAGNSNLSKLDDMNIDYQANTFFATLGFMKGIVNTDYADAERVIDTYTHLSSIKTGFEKETYEDTPYLVPYLVDGSDKAVIVIPGGGFGFKSINGSGSEGKKVAKTLNENGITAFVLYYRTNPYEYPIPYLDVQRAVRYLRYHNEEFHIDKNKISLIGFSAGGNEIGTFINVIQGKNYFPKDYVPDEIDAVDDLVTSSAMIYPAMSFRFNVPMLFCMFDDDLVRNSQKREEMLELTDLYRHLSSQDVLQFIAYGTKDGMVGMDETKKYIRYAKDSGYDVTTLEVEGADHGFGQDFYMKQYIEWISRVFAN